MTIHSDPDVGAPLLLAGIIVAGAIVAVFITEREKRARHVPSILLDDEPVTPEDLVAIAKAQAEIARGESTSWEELRRWRHAGPVAVAG